MMSFSVGRVTLLSTSVTCPLTPKVKFNNQVIRQFSFLSDPLNSVIYLKFKHTRSVFMTFQYGGPVLLPMTPVKTHQIQCSSYGARIRPEDLLSWESNHPLGWFGNCCRCLLRGPAGLNDRSRAPCAEQSWRALPHSLPRALQILPATKF